MGKQQQHKTRAPGGRIEALLFDLDGTLYPTVRRATLARARRARAASSCQ